MTVSTVFFKHKRLFLEKEKLYLHPYAMCISRCNCCKPLMSSIDTYGFLANGNYRTHSKHTHPQIITFACRHLSITLIHTTHAIRYHKSIWAKLHAAHCLMRRSGVRCQLYLCSVKVYTHTYTHTHTRSM